MYLENLPAEYQPENPEAVATIDPEERMRWQSFFDLVAQYDSIVKAREQLGIHWSTYSRWLVHPEFKMIYDRVRQERVLRAEEVALRLACVESTKTHEDRRMVLQALHPSYKKSDQPLTQVNIQINSQSLDKSRERLRKVTDTSST